jgi:hypothetical protein
MLLPHRTEEKEREKRRRDLLFIEDWVGCGKQLRK